MTNILGLKLLSNRKGEKITGKARKRVRYDEKSTDNRNYNAIHDKTLFEVEYPDGTIE